MKTWNRERKRTRDRLLQYNLLSTANPIIISQLVPTPISINESLIENTIFNIAKKYGFSGTNIDFWGKFNTQNIHYGTIDTFPTQGIQYDLYLDTLTHTLYYFKISTSQIDISLAQQIGAIIVDIQILEDTNTTITYLYIPVHALPIENLIYNCGNAFD